MLNAKDAKIKSLAQREILVDKWFKTELESINAAIEFAINHGETFVVINTENWVAGLDERLAKEFSKENYYVVVKRTTLGISWTDA